MPGGRPHRFKSAEQLEKKVNEYFDWADEREELYTVPGMAWYLEYSDRHSIFDLKKHKEFSHTIKKALNRIESQRLQMGLRGKTNPAISIFDLKNNFGYAEKIDQNNSGGFTLSWGEADSGSGDDDEKDS